MNSILTVLRVPSLSGVVGGVVGSWRTLFTRPQLPHALTNTPTPMFGIGGSATPGGGLLTPAEAVWGGASGRTIVRNHFPRPSEKKRIRRHGWKTRMSTLGGRKVLMRRILKGRHVLSH